MQKRWVSNSQGCTNQPDAITYWPIGSPFAEPGSGTCVDEHLADGGHAYYTYTTSATVPQVRLKAKKAKNRKIEKASERNDRDLVKE